MQTASRIIRRVSTGEAVVEIFTDKKPQTVTQYEAVPVLQHLQELNTPGTLAYEYARRAIKN